MKIYMAGLFPSRNRANFSYAGKTRNPVIEYPYDLESYHYLNGANAAPDFYRNVAKKKIFLDSGAFTMFTKGVTIELSEYADYIKANRDWIEVASNIDEIGRGKEKESWDNQKALERLNVKVNPVHHARDADSWLLKYMAEGYDYIFLGGMVAEKISYLQEWLDHVFGKYLTRKDGTAKIKTHGFGITSTAIMRRYPWYSVDSTTWLNGGRFGEILLDLPGGDRRMTISSQSPRVKMQDMHYDTQSPYAKAQLKKYFESLGYDPEQLRVNPDLCNNFNIEYFERMAKRKDPVFKSSQLAATLF